MEIKLYSVEGFEILEILRGRIYEYYVKPYGKNNYIFAFGVLERFKVNQLEVLASRGYFDIFEQD